MLIELIVRAMGGWWGVKRRCEDDRSRAGREFFRLIFRIYLDKMGSYVGFGSRFAGPPFLPHGLRGIFVSGGAKVGHRCTIFQHVTIGANTTEGSSRRGFPTIGDDCYIGAGAKIIGKIVIGSNVRIGANCVVVQDVPDFAVVVMEKPRVILRDPGVQP